VLAYTDDSEGVADADVVHGRMVGGAAYRTRIERLAGAYRGWVSAGSL
jgi:hypothetical protein